MKVVLADDHIIFRQGLKELLEKKLEVEVIGEAGSGKEVVELVAELEPDVVIMDLAMPELNGLEATSLLTKNYPGVKVIILSMLMEDIYVYRALQAGVYGYVLKSSAYEELAMALRAAEREEVFFSPAVSRTIVDEYLRSSSPDSNKMDFYSRLTGREKEVLQLLAEDWDRTEIADALHLSVKTVDRHRENVKEKLELQTDKELREIARLLMNLDS